MCKLLPFIQYVSNWEIERIKKNNLFLTWSFFLDSLRYIFEIFLRNIFDFPDFYPYYSVFSLGCFFTSKYLSQGVCQSQLYMLVNVKWFYTSQLFNNIYIYFLIYSKWVQPALCDEFRTGCNILISMYSWNFV